MSAAAAAEVASAASVGAVVIRGAPPTDLESRVEQRESRTDLLDRRLGAVEADLSSLRPG